MLAGAPDCSGVVGDLGGASLELVRLTADGPVEGATLALGPFALSDTKGEKLRPVEDPAPLLSPVTRHLSPASHLSLHLIAFLIAR